jgi:hypothetical protein
MSAGIGEVLERSEMTQAQATLQRIEQILPQLPLSQLEMVLTFAEFVRERAALQSEEEVLWSFVQREQVYRANHPDEVGVYTSVAELLAALDTQP